MTDRELLEFAAKAAGMSLEDEAFGSLDWWNPLTDSGQCFELAVKLGLGMKRHYYEGDYFIQVPVGDIAKSEPLSNDPCAATRRAFVRAAAALGKEL